MGAVAGIVIDENADRYAYKKGLFVIGILQYCKAQNVRVIMRMTLFIFLLISSLAAQEANDSTAVDQTYLSALRRELACYCGCGMTVQDCLGGMICDESRGLSRQVTQLIKAGKNRQEILQAMVTQYGERILSAPTKKGFNLTAWVLPFLALLIGGVIVGKVVSRWRRQTPGAPASTRSAPATGESAYDKRFEEELRRFDN